ncbi:NAD(P)H-binding protein [Rhodobacteraceae bacterium M385]|nr:NAD(P)H-binding protein [Rhodobacteraceae bacterium M385]
MTKELTEHGHRVVAISRAKSLLADTESVLWRSVADYGDVDALQSALAGADIVIHLADNPSREVYTQGSTASGGIINAVLAAMASCKITRLIVASSVYARAHEAGNETAYGFHKHQIEQLALNHDDVRAVCVQFPPIYGPGCKGGLATLEKLVRTGLPIPLGRATTPRSYISVANAAQALGALAAATPDAFSKVSGRALSVTDGKQFSTRDVIEMIAETIGTRPKLVSVPTGLLRLLGKAARKAELVTGALDALPAPHDPAWLDDLGWAPTATMPETLSYMA